MSNPYDRCANPDCDMRRDEHGNRALEAARRTGQLHAFVEPIPAPQPPADATAKNDEWKRRALAAEALLNAPEIHDFAKAVQLEAAHQRSRWGSDHDAGKTDADWFWLIGYLGGKALRTDDGTEKQLHRIITVAAAACNWHAAKLGQTNMRPGIETPKGLPPDDFDTSVWKNDGKEPVLR